jgi:hypothetical protein
MCGKQVFRKIYGPTKDKIRGKFWILQEEEEEEELRGFNRLS